ncbi:MAG: DUF6879 family protein [Pseudonocardiaceae bacterium]
MRDSYNAPREAESFRKFRTGEQVDRSWAESWFGMIHEATAEGRLFSHVRVVRLPLTDYSRFGLRTRPRLCGTTIGPMPPGTTPSDGTTVTPSRVSTTVAHCEVLSLVVVCVVAGAAWPVRGRRCP